MGKKRRWNKLISKWIKSDLPEDRTSVLLLRVTRPTPSPEASKKRFCIPYDLEKVQARRNSTSASTGRQASLSRCNSRKGPKGERPKARPPNCVVDPKCDSHCTRRPDDKSLTIIENGQPLPVETEASENTNSTVNSNEYVIRITKVKVTPYNTEFQHSTPPVVTEDLRTNTIYIRKTISEKRSAFLNSVDCKLPDVKIVLSSPDNDDTTIFPENEAKCASHPLSFDLNRRGKMETSIDSIGACSLDMETSRELPSDWSEANSTKTLRGSRLSTPQAHHHLPSYLSLACTVNGYSTTTNYDPIRLARSRDASPNRMESNNHFIVEHPTYNVTNNLLSPPNLVPLPTLKVSSDNMTENALRAHHHQEFYSASKTVTFLTKESHHFSNNIYHTKDSTDGCVQRKFVSYESQNISCLNDQSKCSTIESSTISKEYTNGKETKSFIQQRVERLYGPGALAQGFFVSKRRISESENQSKHPDLNKLNKTLPDKLSDEENIEPASMKQSSSSPSLPVFRHLRPEFRAQLPLASPKKVAETQIQKHETVPKLKDEVIVNDCRKSEHSDCGGSDVKENGGVIPESYKEIPAEKDGHYFLAVLENQTRRILALADRVENDINTPDLSEEVIGRLRSTSGKAKLLVSQKMQQFRGLCTNNITQSEGEAFPTTNEDLQGFWDMVMLQVDQVDRMFEEIDRLRENNWKEELPRMVEAKTNGVIKPRKTVSKPKLTAATEQARKQREEQRKKMIEERRKQMKLAQQTNQPSIEIYVPESS